MKKYWPNKTELTMLWIGLMIGSILTLWFTNIWILMAAFAPLLLIGFLGQYLYQKNKQDYKDRLAKAHSAKELQKENEQTSRA